MRICHSVTFAQRPGKRSSACILARRRCSSSWLAHRLDHGPVDTITVVPTWTDVQTTKQKRAAITIAQ